MWRIANELWNRRLVVALLTCHAGLAAWMGYMNAPNANEAAHLATGIYNWRFGQFELYSVNPPLVRMIAALPAVWTGAMMDWENYQERSWSGADARPEWSVGITFVRANRHRAQRLFAQARWMCIPLSLLGGCVCWRWAGQLYGPWAGIVALALWCFSPNVLAWSATICPDASAAAAGVVAAYILWRWLIRPDGFGSLSAGIVLGLALLTKMTWLIAVPLWPLVWAVWVRSHRHCVNCTPVRTQLSQLIAMLAVALLVLNLGYGFEGTCTRLRSFTFVSHALAGADSVVDGGRGGNRFADCWVGNVPIPLPQNYVRGIDLQKYDFERGLPSYLCGEWKSRGWWYYYVACAAVKIPLGTWLLGLIAIVAILTRTGGTITKASQTGHGRRTTALRRKGWPDELVLLAPAVTVVVLVSLESGFSRHFRYVLPALPFLFIWISSASSVALRHPRTAGVVVTGALLWSVSSSLFVYPHSMSYFNEVAGGPREGHRYLLASNIDWGQDIYYLKAWCHAHRDATPLHGLFLNSFSKDLLGIGDIRKPPVGPVCTSAQQRAEGADELRTLGPRPGWYVLSIQRIRDRSKEYLYFLRFRPVATAGYSIYIYHITLEDANRVRKELHLPELVPMDLIET